MKKILLILCIAVLMCMTSLAMNGFASDNWSSDSFTNHYRVFVNGTSTTLSDYQVKLVLHNVTGDSLAENIYLPGIIQPNYNDIRFALNDGTRLNYWMEKPTGTDYATFWIKIPSIPQGTENSVAVDIYYGNSTIGSAADGDATFPLFDDFDGTSLNISKWTTSATVTVSNSQLRFTGSSAKIYSEKQFQNNASLSVFGLPLSSKMIGFRNTNGNSYCYIHTYTSPLRIMTYNGVSKVTENDGPRPSVPAIYTMMWNTTNSSMKVESNPITVGKYNPVVALPVLLGSETSASTAVYDWLFVRQLADEEPTIYTPPVIPAANFSANVTIGTVPLTVKFTDKSTGFPTAWAWDFDNDGVADNTTQNPIYTYNVPGNYSVNLTVTNSAGSNISLQTDLIQVNVIQPPVANFTADTLSGDAPLTVHFTDLSTGIITSRAWDFDNDGTIDSTEQNPTYTFNVPSNYTVNLTVSNYGGNNTVSDQIIVNTPALPAADFTADTTNGIAPLNVHFTGQSTGIVTTWAWDFNNDGKIDATTQNATYTYSDPGIYTVNLTVTNAGGSNSTKKADYINVTSIPPIADFSADVTTGKAALKVNFTDNSTGSISGWVWDFDNDGIIDATTRNASYTYIKAGNYTVNLTVTGPSGSNSAVKTDYIQVMSNIDLSGTAAFVTSYPNYDNTVRVTVTNSGTENAAAFNVTLLAGENSTALSIPELTVGNSTTFSITDIKRKLGDIVPITVAVDPENKIVESNETNNEYETSTTIVSTGNYYTGGRYYTGNDEETGAYQEGNIAIKYSQGDSGYKSGGGWYSTTVHWTGTDLPIPANATVKAARLYQSYTWNYPGNPGFSLQFNGNTVNQTVFYGDGTDNFNGQGIFDVTPYFNKNGNTAIINASNPGTGVGGLYGAVLVVIYEDASEPYRMIWLDEGCDTLFGGTDELHTAYAMFNNVTTENLNSAKITTVLPSGSDNNQSTILFNGQSIPITGSIGSDPAYCWYNVIGALQSSKNELGVRDDGGYINLASAILEVTKETASEANFSANKTSGDAPLSVKFTDTSTGTPANWTWNFGDGGTSTEQNPTHIYTTGGTYNVTLTESNSLGSDSEVKTGYITVNSAVLAPVAKFSSNVTSGEAPLSVQFNDESANAPASWAWDFGDGNTSTVQNPTHTYVTAGNYTVSLTATNSLGSNSTVKTDFIEVTSAGSAAPVSNFNIVLDEYGKMPHGLAPITVSFTDSSTGTIDSYLWEYRIEDNGTWTAFGSGAKNPTGIVFPDVGTYDIRLTVTNSAGSSNKTIAHAFAAGKMNDYLTTITNGTVSGDLYVNSQSPWPETTHTYSYTLPASGSNIAWARIYVNVYSGSGTSNFPVRITTELDPTGTGSWTTLGVENGDIQSETNGESPDGQPYAYPINDHTTKVYSDYEVWYDVTSLLTSTTPQIRVTSSDIGAPVGTDSGFDGRIKAVTLVVAYNDGSTKQVKYIVNHGNDWMTGSSSTAFDASSFASGWTNATLTEVAHSSTDATYTLNGVSVTPTSLGSNSYYKYNTFNVTSALNPAATNTYGFSNTGASFKICLATLAATYPGTTTVPAPVANFTADPTSGKAPLTVQFTDTSAGNVTSWNWDFGDNTNSTGQNVSHTYASAGLYTVSLTVTGPGGSDSEVKTEYINVSTPIPAKPVAAFSASPTLGIMPLNVQFSDQSTGVPTNYTWTFGDGSTSYEQNPSHVYSKVGKFTVKLTVKNAKGSNSTTKTNYIDVEEVPVAEFSANRTVGKLPMAVKFTDKSTGTPTSWYWDFGDGNTSTEKSPTNVYGEVGKYNVTLTATNAVGNNTIIKSSYIDVEVVPLANFSADPTVGIMPLSVSFTDRSTGAPTSWKWNFGDGTNSTEQNPSHIYSKVGKFTVSLTAKNAVGSNTSRKTKYIDVELVPVADFAANKTVGKLPMSVKFTDKSTGTSTSWNWDFGDGNTSTEKSPTNVYGAVGRYNVTLTATNDVGSNTTTKYSYIDVEVVPVANFTADPAVGANPLNVSFTDLSTGAPTSWTWTFGDGSASTEQNPSHEYTEGGQFTVKLTAKNPVGSNSTKKTKYITVESVPVASFSASPTSGAHPLSVTFTDRSTGYPESWNWDFGDGNTSTEQKPVHTYSLAGRYTVKLTVTNLAGNNTKSMSGYIKVS